MLTLKSPSPGMPVSLVNQCSYREAWIRRLCAKGKNVRTISVAYDEYGGGGPSGYWGAWSWFGYVRTFWMSFLSVAYL